MSELRYSMRSTTEDDTPFLAFETPVPIGHSITLRIKFQVNTSPLDRGAEGEMTAMFIHKDNGELVRATGNNGATKPRSSVGGSFNQSPSIDFIADNVNKKAQIYFYGLNQTLRWDYTPNVLRA